MGINKSNATTIKDIAKDCGVSITTVSRVLSNKDYPVSTKVREAILESAKRLNYTPNPFARSLKTNSSSEIAVIVPSITNPFYTSLVSGIERVLSEEGRNILLYKINKNISEELITNLICKRLEGIIICGGKYDDNTIKQIKKKANQLNNIVFVDSSSSDNKFSNIRFDYKKGSMIAAEYLIANGHRSIVYASLNPEIKSREDRIDGFKEAMKNAELPLNSNSILIHRKSDMNNENDEFYAGISLAEEILKLKSAPSAVLATNDMVAFGILHHLNKSDIKVPDEISVVGLDDILFCQFSYPALTTIKVPAQEMGYAAAKLLLELTKNKTESALNITLEPTIIERNSVKKF